MKRLAVEDGDASRGVVLDDGDELEGRNVVSSAGWCETMRLCDDGQPVVDSRAPGSSRSAKRSPVLDAPAAASSGTTARSCSSTTATSFTGRSPDELCDVRSGVICSPNNFAYDASRSDDGTDADHGAGEFRPLAGARRRRATAWKSSAGTTGITESAVRFVPDFRAARDRHRHVHADHDRPLHRPRQRRGLRRPEKQLDGTTHLKNLFICGTDQGFVGIIGASPAASRWRTGTA